MGRKRIVKNKIRLVGDTPARSFFINPADTIQWRYEMIRQASLTRKPIEEISKQFGYSRDMYFYYKGKFEAAGILGLADFKPGPRRPRKRTTSAGSSRSPNTQMEGISTPIIHTTRPGICSWLRTTTGIRQRSTTIPSGER